MSLSVADQLFLTYLGRPADPAWRGTTGGLISAQGGQPALALQSTFYDLALAEGRFKVTDTPGSLVNKIFLQVFGSPATGFEQEAWGNLIRSGAIPREAAAWTIFKSYLGKEQSNLAAYQAPARSRLYALEEFSKALIAYPGVDSSYARGDPEATALGADYMSGIRDVAGASVAVSGLQGRFIFGSTVRTLKLVAGKDPVGSALGGMGSDLFLATRAGSSSASNTLTSEDDLDGGPGFDTLQIDATASDANLLGGARLKNIEAISVRSLPKNTSGALDLSAVSGVASVGAELCEGTLMFDALPVGTAISIVGNSVLNNGLVNFRYSVPSSDVTLVLSGGTKGLGLSNLALGVAATLKATINSRKAPNEIGLLSFDENTVGDLQNLMVNAEVDLKATLDTTDYPVNGADLTVIGSGKVDLGSGGIFKTIYASANTGGLTMTLNAKTAVFQGTTAGDVITTALLGAVPAGAIDAGPGMDTLVIENAATVANPVQRAAYKGFEILVNASGSPVAVDNFPGLQLLQAAGSGGGFTGMTSGLASNILVSTNQSGASGVKFSLTNATGTGDVLGLTMGVGTGASPAANVSVGPLDVTGFETLILKSNPGPDASVIQKTSQVASLIAPTLQSLFLNGPAVEILSVGSGAAAGKGGAQGAVSTPLAIDASALTGDGSGAGSKGFKLVGTLVPGSAVSGSDWIDTFDLDFKAATTQSQRISGGQGGDTIKVAIDGAVITSGSVVIDGGSGKDTITIIGNNTSNPDASANAVIRIREGESGLTAPDEVNGATASVEGKHAFRLDFDGTASAHADVSAGSVTGHTSEQLKYTVIDGLLKFEGSSATALKFEQKATIAQTVITTADRAVAFVDGTDSYVFHNGATADSLVKLVGLSLLGIGAAKTGHVDVG